MTKSATGPFAASVVALALLGGYGIAQCPPSPLVTGLPQIVGTGQPDVLIGTATAEEIAGCSGGDTIAAGGGSDVVHGNSGLDQISGQDGNDTINGNEDDDVVNGNGGNDTVRGGQGADVVHGGQGDDIVYGDLGDDLVRGDLGDDLLVYRQGDGADVWSDSQGSDRAVFMGAAFLVPASVSYRRVNASLEVYDAGGQRLTTIENQFSGAPIEAFHFQTSVTPLMAANQPLTNNAPFGAASATGTVVSGWAFDPNRATGSIGVTISVQELFHPFATHSFVVPAANLFAPFVAPVLPVPAAHASVGFSLDLATVVGFGPYQVVVSANDDLTGLPTTPLGTMTVVNSCSVCPPPALTLVRTPAQTVITVADAAGLSALNLGSFSLVVGSQDILPALLALVASSTPLANVAVVGGTTLELTIDIDLTGLPPMVLSGCNLGGACASVSG